MYALLYNCVLIKNNPKDKVSRQLSFFAKMTKISARFPSIWLIESMTYSIPNALPTLLVVLVSPPFLRGFCCSFLNLSGHPNSH